MPLQRKPLQIAIGATIISLLALLAYSLERTVWLFSLFEERAWLAFAAAVVVELAAVALLAGAGIIATLNDEARAWANRALAAVLSVQALANLSAGYLRGGQGTKGLWGVDSAWFGYTVAGYLVTAALWLVTNLAVPALILCLSKLLEQMLSALPTKAQKEETQRVRLTPVLAHQKSVDATSVSLPLADRQCKYCHQTGLTATEVARHGRQRKRTGACS